MNSRGHYKISEKQTTNICSPKQEETTKHLYSQKSGHYKTFVVPKSGHYKTFVVLKSGHYKTLVVSKKRTLQKIYSLKKADPTNHL